MSGSRAADDFTTIRARMEELRRERDASAAAKAGDPRVERREAEAERRRRERMQGFPPPWVPTIFVKKPRA